MLFEEYLGRNLLKIFIEVPLIQNTSPTLKNTWFSRHEGFLKNMLKALHFT